MKKIFYFFLSIIVASTSVSGQKDTLPLITLHNNVSLIRVNDELTPINGQMVADPLKVKKAFRDVLNSDSELMPSLSVRWLTTSPEPMFQIGGREMRYSDKNGLKFRVNAMIVSGMQDGSPTFIINPVTGLPPTDTVQPGHAPYFAGNNTGLSLKERFDVAKMVLDGFDPVLAVSLCRTPSEKGIVFAAVMEKYSDAELMLLNEKLDWSGAEIVNVNLSGRCLYNARFKGARIEHCYLVGADLRGADLRGASLYDSDLTNANLKNALMHNCNICETKGLKASK